MFQTHKAPRTLTASSTGDFSPYQNTRRAKPANDCFRTTMDFLNPSESAPSQKSMHRSDYRDHTDLINISPVKRRIPTDELNLGLVPRGGNSGSMTCRPRYREKDTSMDNIGELSQRDITSGRKHVSNLSFQNVKRGEDLNIFDPSFHRTETRDDMSQLSVSKALKTIYEQCHESAKLLPASGRSLSSAADKKGSYVFNEVLSGLDAAGHTTYHKNFTSPREGKKRFANTQSIISEQAGLSLAEDEAISRRKNVQQITKGSLGADLVPGLKGIPEEKPFRLVSKQSEEDKQNEKAKPKKGRNNDETANKAQEDGLMSARGLGSDYSHQDSRYSTKRGDVKSKGLPLKKGFWSQINSNYGLGKRLPLTGNPSYGVDSRTSLNSSRSQRLGP